MSFVGCLMSVVSRRGRSVAVLCLISFLRLVSRFARRLVLISSRLAYRYPWRGGGSCGGVAGVFLSSCGQSDGVLFFSFRLARWVWGRG